MVQYLTPMPLVLTLVRNACSYQVCLHSFIVIQLPTLWQRKCHCIEYNIISGNYLDVTTLGEVVTTHTELMNAAMPFFVALYGQPRGLLAQIFSQRTKKNLKVMASQPYYGIIWPHVSSPSELIASNEEHISNNNPEASKKFVVFEKYQEISA